MADWPRDAMGNIAPGTRARHEPTGTVLVCRDEERWWRPDGDMPLPLAPDLADLTPMRAVDL